MWKGAIVATFVAMIACNHTIVASYLPSWFWNFIIVVVLSTISFLGFLIAFVNVYIGKDLRKCSPLNEHLAYVNEETQSSQCIKDLDKVASSKGLSQTWLDEIELKSAACKVLLTGVTGYVGKAFLFQILREIAEAEADGYNNLQHKVYVVIRPKVRKKKMTAAERLDLMRKDSMFSCVEDQWDRVVVAVESGDLQEDQCGLSSSTIQLLAEAELTHVVHCAADVNFNRPLEDSAGINISPALQLLALSHTWPSCKRFVHCSTAFVNPGCGSPDAPLPEELFPLGKYKANELFDSMKGDKALALEAKADLKFPNNYVFTKCVAEHLLAENNREKELKIIRPAIIGPAWVLPEPGWNGDKPSTITALFLLWGTRVIRFAPLNSNPIPMVPVDVVVVALLNAMISASESATPPSPPAELPEVSTDGLEDGATTVIIRNLTWSHTSPHKFVDGMRMAKTCIPVGVLKHHFTATEAALSYALIDASTRYPCLFQILHRIFNLGPLKLLQFVCWLGRVSGIRSILDKLPVTKLLNFSDMLYLYRPYLARAFFFESSYNVPPSLSMNQYCISLFTATHAFWKNLFPGTVDDLHELELLPEGRWDLWWALTVSVSFRNRIINYLACKIIRETYGSVELNFVTLFHAGRVMLHLEETMNQHKHCVVLTPPSRSLMDYILVKYIAFSMVGLGIDVPRVYSEPEFNDPKIKTRVGKTKARFDRHAVLAAFLEGSPSSDGRLKKPNTKFLKDLVESPGYHKYTLIPLCIDYDRVEINSEALKRATRRSSDIGILKLIRLYWRVRSRGRQRPTFGDVRISFGVPTSLEPDSDFDLVSKHVQNEHRRLTTVSEYQIKKAEFHLNISNDTLRAALEQLSTRVCNNKSERISQKTGTFMELYSNNNDLWRLHMQWMPRFAPYLADSHPKWARWIMGGTPVSTPPEEEIVKTNEIYTVLKAICVELDAVEGLAHRAAIALRDEKESFGSLPVESMVEKMIAIDPDTVSTSGLPICKAAASFILNEF